MNIKQDKAMDALFILALAAIIVVAIVCYAPTIKGVEASQEPTEPIVVTTECVTEPTEIVEVATEPTVALYDVPLDEGLQLHIIATAEANGIDPAIIMAMAFKESTYNPYAVGDNGNSLGLLQVQPRWHSERMAKLNCPNLLDPYQNVVVAVDYLCELLNKYGSLDKALTAYNRGHYNGTVTEYAKVVLAKAEELVVE